MNLRQQKGQALIETIFTSGVTLISFTVMLLMGYRGLVYFTARHSVNDLLFCLSSMKSQTFCESEFNKKTKSFLIFKESSQLKIEKNPRQIAVSFNIQAAGTPALRLERTLLQPLERNL